MANANIAAMGPPPSPKEPRRSGRRSAPSASTSKSPAGSPPSDSAPKAKENVNRPPLQTTSNSSKNKRAKQEEHDDPLEEVRKNGVNGNGAARTKRKGKDKEKTSAVVEVAGAEGEEELPHPDALGGDITMEGDEVEEEQGITRCICSDEEPEAAGEFMAQCEMCSAWQHGQCMGFANIEALPQHYYCEQCRPDLYVELLKRHAKRARQSSTHSHHTATAARHTSRSSRSHSPMLHAKPTKRRNTMNSRDAAYEESFQALIEATAAEAAAAAQEVHATTPVASSSNGEPNGTIEPEQDPELVVSSRRKRKRSEDDAVATKRTRSASIASDRTTAANGLIGHDATPINSSNGNAQPILAPPSVTKGSSSRSRRAPRKSQLQDLVSVEGDEANGTAPARRQATSRTKAATGNENVSRRTQGSSAIGHGVNSTGHANTSAATRAYHQSHAYAVSQQPLFTSWNLPDYLAHLEPMLPTDTPRPLEVRGSGIDPTGQGSQERTTERGVKVKWPSKRMSVGDMNKRVRSLVEWVGREQASALERSRRREAIEKALRDAQLSSPVGLARADGRLSGDIDDVMVVDGGTIDSPAQEKAINGLSSVPHTSSVDSGQTTMRMMEELMEELITFQERFGPGAKTKERERRTTTV